MLQPLSDWLGLVALGGALGGVARIWVSALVARRFSDAFPWDTLVVNVTGAAAIGGLAAWLLDGGDGAARSGPLWSALVFGILGSYTTVSTFALQTLTLLRAGAQRAAVLNVLASFGLCLLAVAAGHGIVQALLGLG